MFKAFCKTCGTPLDIGGGAGLDPERIRSFLGMLARRLEIERRARHDPQDSREARELLDEIAQQISALEALK